MPKLSDHIIRSLERRKTFLLRKKEPNRRPIEAIKDAVEKHFVSPEVLMELKMHEGLLWEEVAGKLVNLGVFNENPLLLDDIFRAEKAFREGHHTVGDIDKSLQDDLERLKAEALGIIRFEMKSKGQKLPDIFFEALKGRIKIMWGDSEKKEKIKRLTVATVYGTINPEIIEELNIFFEEFKKEVEWRIKETGNTAGWPDQIIKQIYDGYSPEEQARIGEPTKENLIKYRTKYAATLLKKFFELENLLQEIS